MDRLRTIHTKGYSTKEKHIIGEKYLLPRLLKHYAIKDLVISEEAWQWILNERKEDGVRNLKRDLETIVSRLNLLQLFRTPATKNEHSKESNPREDTPVDEKSPEKDEDLPKGVPRGIKWTMGETLGKDDVQVLLEGRNTKNSNIPFGMYC